jgi:hypothetical protein
MNKKTFTELEIKKLLDNPLCGSGDVLHETFGVRHHEKTKRAFCTCGKYKELKLCRV